MKIKNRFFNEKENIMTNRMVVPYVNYAVIREDDYVNYGNIDRAVAYGLDKDAANDLCNDLTKSEYKRSSTTNIG